MSTPARAFGALLCLCLSLGTAQGTAQLRPEVQGRSAAVVADHPLAAAAGADVLRRGGNAVDAAVTMAAVLAVVRPHLNGVGGDAFLLIREGRSGRVHALNGSGRAGERATPAAFLALGLNAMPAEGVLTVTVPGAVRAWGDALRRHGTIRLAEALAPAIGYATAGFPVSERLAAELTAAQSRIAADPALAAVFLPGGAPPQPGTLLLQRDLGLTLQLLARDGAEALYTGDLARTLDAFMAQENGHLTLADLARHSSTWQEPIATTYRGYRVLGTPPNTQGIALLMQLNMAQPFDLAGMGHNRADYVRTLVEIRRLAVAERNRHVADPAFSEVPLDRMLSPQHARQLLESWREPVVSDAGTPPRALPQSVDGGNDVEADAVFLAAVDEQGNAVALVQSLYGSFGSGRMLPGTGVVLHNRGAGFSLERGHVNVVAPRKRPYHTLSAAMVLNPDNSLFMVLGTGGSDGQTETQVQVLHNILLFGMGAQRAVDAPRWRWRSDGTLQVEDGIPADVRAGLSQAGLSLRLQQGPAPELGGAQVILVGSSGIRSVGADPRREAYGIAW